MPCPVPDTAHAIVWIRGGVLTQCGTMLCCYQAACTLLLITPSKFPTALRVQRSPGPMPCRALGVHRAPPCDHFPTASAALVGSIANRMLPSGGVPKTDQIQAECTKRRCKPT
eukprot:523654-Rhodomonas_salina.1